MSATQLTGRQIKSLGGDISGQGNAVSVDKIKGTPISATAPTTGQSLVFNGTSWTPTNGAGGAASALATTGADVDVSSAAPPTTGQVLTATSATTATWQTPSGGGSNPYAGTGAFVLTNSWKNDSGAPNYQPARSEAMAYDGANFWMMDTDNGSNDIVKTDLTGLVVNRYTLPEQPVDLLFAFGALWAVCSSPTLYKINITTGAVDNAYTSGKGMSHIAANATYLFLSGNGGGPVVYQFDPVNETFNNLQDKSETSAPDSIATNGSNYLWIIDHSSATIRRVLKDPVYATLGVFNLSFTAIPDGTAGNAITIKFEFKGDGLPDVAVTGSDIVITIFNQTGLSREFQIANAVNQHPTASTLVRAFAGSPSSIHNYNQAPYNTAQNLTGGVDHDLGTIDVSASGLPWAGMYSGFNNVLYVTMDNGDLLKIDAESDTVLGTFPSGAAEIRGICTDGSDFVFVTETDPSNKIRMFDMINEYFVDNLGAPNNPDDIAVDFSNNWIVSLDRSSGLVRKIDRKTGSLISTIDISAYGLARRGVFFNSYLWVVTSTGFFVQIDLGADSIASASRTGQLMNTQSPTNLTGGADAVAATRSMQDVTYTANAAGNAANFVTVGYTGGATAGSEVVTVDPQTPGMVVSVPMHRGYDTLFDGTDLWLSGNPDNQVLRVSTDGVVKKVYTGFFDIPREMAWDGASIWVMTNSAILIKLDPATDHRVAFQINNGTGTAIAYDGLSDASDLTSATPGGNMWVATNAGFMFKFEADGTVTSFSGFAWTNPAGMAFDGTNMWVIDHSDGFIYKVTPAGVATPYAITGSPWDIAFDGTNMWTANDDASVSKIAPSGTETNYPGLSGSATGIAFDGTDMWTSDRSSAGFSKIDPSGTITSFVGPGPQGSKIAFDGEFMWSAADQSDDLLRVAALGTGPATAISVQIEDLVSTAQNIVDAVNGFPAAFVLVTASTASPSNPQTVEGYSFLTGGMDAIAATLVTNGGGGSYGQDFYLTYTAVTPGAAGNAITIEYTGGGTAGSEIVSVVGTDISVQIESGVSKWEQIADAVNADVLANLLVTATTNSRTASALVGITQWDGDGFYVSEPGTKNVFRISVGNGLQTIVQYGTPNTPDDLTFDGGGSFWSLDGASTRIRRFDGNGVFYGGPSTVANGGFPLRMSENLPGGELWVTMTTGHILALTAYENNGGITKTFDSGTTDLVGIYGDGGSNFHLSAAGTTDQIARFAYNGGFFRFFIEPKDLDAQADRIKISGNYFWTMFVGDDNLRKVEAATGDTLVTTDISADGSPLDICPAGTNTYISATNGKMIRVNNGIEQGVAELVVQDLTFVSNSPGSGGNSYNVEYTGGGTLGTATVTVYDGTRLVVDIESGVTTADTVLAAILVTTGNGNFTTTLTGTGSNAQVTAAQAFFTGGGDITPFLLPAIQSAKTVLAGLSEVTGWPEGGTGPAVGYTAPADGYMHFAANGQPNGVGDGFHYIGTVIFDGNPQNMAADANDLWVCDNSGPDAPFRILISSMQVVAHVTGAFGNNNGALGVIIVGGYVYFGDDNFPVLHKIDPATNAQIRPINVGDATGGNQFARVLGLYHDGTNIWVASTVNSDQNVMIEKIVSDRTVAGIHDIGMDTSSNQNPMVRIGDSLFLRSGYILHRFNVNLG